MTKNEKDSRKQRIIHRYPNPKKQSPSSLEIWGMFRNDGK